MTKPTSLKLVLAVVAILTVASVGYAGLTIWRNTGETANQEDKIVYKEETRWLQ